MHMYNLRFRILLVFVLIASFLGNDLRASDSSNQMSAMEIIRTAVHKSRQLKSIKFDVAYSVFNAAEKKAPLLLATITLAKQEKADEGNRSEIWGMKGLYFSDNTIVDYKGDSFYYRYAYDGKEFSLYDNQKKELTQVQRPDAVAIARVMAKLGIVPTSGSFYCINEDMFPVFSTMKENQVTLKGIETIANVPCYVIHLKKIIGSPNGDSLDLSSDYFFSKDDFLYRGYRSKTGQSLIKRIHQKDLTLSSDAFAIKAPTGATSLLVTGMEAMTTGLLPKGSLIQDWELTGPSEIRRMADYRGKVVLFDFWGTWCAPCIRAMPHLEAMYQKYKDKGLVVVGISVNESEDADPIRFAKAKGVTYEILGKGEPIMGRFGKMNGFPTLYLLDKKGKVVHAETGLREGAYTEIEKMIEQLLKE